MTNLTNEQKDLLISELDRILDYFQIESSSEYYIIKGDFVPFLFYRVIKNKPLEDLSKITLIRNQHRLFFNLRNNQSVSGYNYGIKYDRRTKSISHDFFTNPSFINLIKHDFIDFRFIINFYYSNYSAYCTAIYLIDEEIRDLKIHPCETILDNLIYVIQNTCRFHLIQDKHGRNIEFFPTGIEHFTKLFSTQIWKGYSSATEIPNAIIRKDNNIVKLSECIPSGRKFKINTNDASNDLPIHPLLLKKTQIKRLLDSFHYLGESFTLVFWNEIIKNDFKIPKNFRNTVFMVTIPDEDKYHIFNELKSKKLNEPLSNIIKFFYNNANNPSIFWNFYLNFFTRNSIPFISDLNLDKINSILHESLLNFTQKASKISETLNKYKIKILTNASELDLEGEFMEHCIGKGNYDKYLNPNNIFFHIRTGWIIKSDSTVMLSYNPLTHKWRINDHKGFKNERPSKKHVKIVDKIINELNYIFLKGIQ